jgi:hypothetical protein
LPLGIANDTAQRNRTLGKLLRVCCKTVLLSTSWGRRDTIDRKLPGGGAPCTAIARPPGDGALLSVPRTGLRKRRRRRSALEVSVCHVLVCHDVSKNPGRTLLTKYNFFMLQQDNVLPERHFFVIAYDLCVRVCLPRTHIPRPSQRGDRFTRAFSWRGGIYYCDWSFGALEKRTAN